VRGSLRLHATTQAEDVSALLREQWALSLRGETAPPGLLAELAAGERGEAMPDARLEREKTRAATARPAGATANAPAAPIFANPDMATLPAEPRTSAMHASQASWASERDTNGNARATNASEALSQSRAHARGHQRPEGVNTNVPALLSTDVRSLHTPELPPLLPAHVTTEAVLPVAVATARQGARVEAQRAAQLDEPTADDLDALAEKFKLILDEQARRHGIDV
jgi:hypothetical protein